MQFSLILMYSPRKLIFIRPVGRLMQHGTRGVMIQGSARQEAAGGHLLLVIILSLYSMLLKSLKIMNKHERRIMNHEISSKVN